MGYSRSGHLLRTWVKTRYQQRFTISEVAADRVWFLFFFHCNYGHIFYRYRDEARYWSKVGLLRTHFYTSTPLEKTVVNIFTSDKGGGKCVCPRLSVCLSVCLWARLHKTRGWIWMKFCMSTDVGTWTNRLIFEPDPDHSPDPGAGFTLDFWILARYLKKLWTDFEI